MTKLLNLRRFDTYTQTTGSSSLSPEMKTYYDMTLLDNAEPQLVHDQFAVKKPVPQGKGKTIEFRKYSAIPKKLTALTEGTTPAGTSLDVSAVTATVAQYGDWVQLSDVLQLTAIDDNVQQAVELLGASAGRTLDTITREILAASTYMDWAGYTSGGSYTASTSRKDITKTCVLTPDMIYKAAAELKAQNAQTVDGQNYVAIAHPYVIYDLMRNTEWIDSHKYAAPENLFSGEIGKIGGVRFVQTTEAKIDAPKPILGMSFNRTTVYSQAAASQKNILLSAAISAADVTAATAAIAAGDNKVYIGGTEFTITSVVAGSAGTGYLVASANLSAAINANTMVCGIGAGKDGSAVFHTIFVGKNAYATTEIDDGGLQTIIKQLGYGEDPLNQRSSVGWKAIKTAKILAQEYMYRWESGSAFSPTAQSN